MGDQVIAHHVKELNFHPLISHLAAIIISKETNTQSDMSPRQVENNQPQQNTNGTTWPIFQPE